MRACVWVGGVGWGGVGGGGEGESHRDSVIILVFRELSVFVVWFCVFLLRLTAVLGLPCPDSHCPSSLYLICKVLFGFTHFDLFGDTLTTVCVCWRLGGVWVWVREREGCGVCV